MATCRNVIVMEMSNAATTQYTEWDMAGMIEHGGLAYGGNEDGFFQLQIDNEDNGSDISAYVKLPLVDFGVLNQKRIRTVFLGLETNGDMYLSVFDDQDNERTYTISPSNRVSREHGTKVKVGRDGKGRYFQLEVGNSGGADFGLDSIAALVSILASTKSVSDYGHTFVSLPSLTASASGTVT